MWADVQPINAADGRKMRRWLENDASFACKGACSLPFLFGSVFGLDEVEGVGDEFLHQVGGCLLGVYAYPVLGALVEGVAYKVVFRPQLFDALRLAFQHHPLEAFDIEKAEHVPANVKHQYVFAMLEFSEWKFFLHRGVEG